MSIIYKKMNDSFSLADNSLVPNGSIRINDTEEIFPCDSIEAINNELKKRGYEDLVENEMLGGIATTKEEYVSGNFKSEIVTKLLKKYRSVGDFLATKYPPLTEEERKKRREEIYLIKQNAIEMENARIRENIKMRKQNSCMPQNQIDNTFDTIIIDEDNKQIIKAMKKYLQENIKGKGFFLYGEPGGGKTTLLSCLLNEHIKKGVDVYFQKGISLVSDTINDKHLKDKLQYMPVLVIDDITQKVGTEYYMSTLYEIIDERINKGLITHFSSNLSLDNTMRLWGKKELEKERLNALYSRLRSCTIECQLQGKDRRQNLTLEDFIRN